MKKVLYNATFFSYTHFQPMEAIYIEEGKIRAIGSYYQLRLEHGQADVEFLDLQGTFVYPGFVDNHLHLPGHGMRLSMLDFSSACSKKDMLHLLKKQIEKTPVGKWVLGLNWDENTFDVHQIPTIQELDAISNKHPIFLTRTCTHAYLANSLAFEYAHITKYNIDPPDGSYGRDVDGHFNGLIYEKAADPFAKAQGPTDYTLKKSFVKNAVQDALRLGLTAAHTEDLRYVGDVSTLLRIYQELRKEGIVFRTNHLIYYPHLKELDAHQLRTGDGDEWFQIGAVKIFADGSIGARTALLSEPYHDHPTTHGIAMHTQEELNEIIIEARQRKMPIAVHAIGDGGVEMVIRAMEAYPARGGTPFRDRLIHTQVIRPDQIERLQKLQVAVDIQPRFVASDFPWVLDRVNEHRHAYLYPWKTLISSGIPCGGGSDAPIEPLDPLLGIHAAITRRKPGQAHSGYGVHEKLTIAEAIRLFTLGGAQTATEENERGTIDLSKFADFTVLDRNLFLSEADDILDTKVQMTIVNGKVAYRS